MSNEQYTQMCKQMKEYSMDVECLTKTINAIAEGFHVCEQEVINYLIKNESIPKELEDVLDTIFIFQKEQGGAQIASGQMSLGLEVEYEI